MNLSLGTDSEADKETVDPATLNAWDTATLGNIHDLTEKGIHKFVTFSKTPFGKTEEL